MEHTLSTPATVLKALQTFYPDSSRRTLENWIKNGRVYLDDKVLDKPHLPLLAGQKLTLGKKEPRPAFQGIRYLHVDRHLIVIDKPTALLSVPSNDPEEESALELLREDFRTSTIYPVHRLDRECSGVLLFARGKLAESRLEALFEKHDLEREYLAIIEGHLASDSGTWRSYLYEKENFEVVLSDEKSGKLAITHYQTLRRSAKFTYLRLLLETGRKHQIRVHCKEAGHPIAGDTRYRAFTNPIHRLCLHAHRLTLTHPFTHAKLTFRSPLPKPFSALGLNEAKTNDLD